MWKFYLNAILTLAALIAPPSFARGGQDGSGGGVIRCEIFSSAPTFSVRIVKGQRQIFQVPNPTALSHNRDYEFLDLWEAEVGSGPFFSHRVEVPYDPRATKEELISRALARLAEVDADLAQEVQSYHVYVTSRMFKAPAGTYVLGPDDTDIRFLPKGCSPPVGLGLYSDRDDNLVYDAEMMAKLPPIDRAAFEIHEALYKYLRAHRGAKDSWQTRRIVGLMFSSAAFTKTELASDFRY